MKVYFTQGEPQEVVDAIQDKLRTRRLGKNLQLQLEGENISILFKKLGTSSIYFSRQSSTGEGCHYELTQEKIAFAHKPFRQEVYDKLVDIVQSIGGRVDQA